MVIACFLGSASADTLKETTKGQALTDKGKPEFTEIKKPEEQNPAQIDKTDKKELKESQKNEINKNKEKIRQNYDKNRKQNITGKNKNDRLNKDIGKLRTKDAKKMEKATNKINWKRKK